MTGWNRLQQPLSRAHKAATGGWRVTLTAPKERPVVPVVLLAIAADGISGNGSGATGWQRTVAAMFRAIAGPAWRDGTFPQATPAEPQATPA